MRSNWQGFRCRPMLMTTRWPYLWTGAQYPHRLPTTPSFYMSSMKIAKIVAQVDAQPREGTYPTGIWGEGEIVPDKHTVPLPDDLPEGEYTVYIGWYTPARRGSA